MFTPFSYTVEELGAFRQAVYTDCLTARADALFELGDALLTTPYVTSPVALSLSPSFRRKWPSVFDALSDGRVDRAALRRVLLRFAPPDPTPLWAIDHTLWARPDADTLPDRGFYHQPTRVPGGKPVGIGHAYTTVGIVPEREGSWCLPLDQRRISTAQTPLQAGAAQLKALLASVDFRPLVTGDSAYACAPFLGEMRGAPCDLLLRVRPNRVLYREPGPYPGRGRPRIHGARFALADPTTWGPPDQEWEGEDPSGKRLHVRAWDKLHFKGATQVKGLLILVEWPDAKGTRRDPKRLWLFWVGQTKACALPDAPALWETLLPGALLPLREDHLAVESGASGRPGRQPTVDGSFDPGLLGAVDRTGSGPRLPASLGSNPPQAAYSRTGASPPRRTFGEDRYPGTGAQTPRKVSG